MKYFYISWNARKADKNSYRKEIGEGVIVVRECKHVLLIKTANQTTLWVLYKRSKASMAADLLGAWKTITS